MVYNNFPLTDTLNNQSKLAVKIKFSGRLDVLAGGSQRWSIYFSKGHILWIRGWYHWRRRWRRLLAQYCPQIPLHYVHSYQGENLPPTSVPRDSANILRYDTKFAPPSNVDPAKIEEDYCLLVQWVEQVRLTREQAANFVRETIVEVLFDILQQENMSPLNFFSNYETLDASLDLIVYTERVFNEVGENWKSWERAGLGEISPNAGLLLKHPQQLLHQLSPEAYLDAVRTIDGSKTLRELALLLRKDLLILTSSLREPIRTGCINLIKIPDLSLYFPLTPRKPLHS